MKAETRTDYYATSAWLTPLCLDIADVKESYLQPWEPEGEVCKPVDSMKEYCMHVVALMPIMAGLASMYGLKAL